MDVSIVRIKPFESAVNKTPNEHEYEMSYIKQNAVTYLTLDRTSRIDDQCSYDLSYFEQIQDKRRKLSLASPSYINCRLVPATACLVERLFRGARWILTILQKSLSPILFKGMLFLKINRRLWDIKLDSSAMKLNPQEIYMERDDDLFYRD